MFGGFVPLGALFSSSFHQLLPPYPPSGSPRPWRPRPHRSARRRRGVGRRPAVAHQRTEDVEPACPDVPPRFRPDAHDYGQDRGEQRGEDHGCRDEPVHLPKQRFGAVAVLDIGGMDVDVQQQALRVDEDVALAAEDLLPDIEAGRTKRAPPFTAPLALWASRIAVVGLASRPARSRFAT